MYVLDERSESHCYDIRAEFCLVFTRVWVINKRKATALKSPHFSASYNSWIHCTRPLRLTFLPTKGVTRVGEPGGVLFDAGSVMYRRFILLFYLFILYFISWSTWVTREPHVGPRGRHVSPTWLWHVSPTWVTRECPRGAHVSPTWTHVGLTCQTHVELTCRPRGPTWGSRVTHVDQLIKYRINK